jgi:GNAT superfamily N-acetyltransferase
MIDPVVRSGGPGDEPALATLEAEARGSLLDARGGSRWLDEHPEIGDAWDSAMTQRAVFVAEIEGRPPVTVGYLVLDLVDDVAVVDQVYVTPEARELGFGDALLEAATSHAVTRGARLLEGQALPGDRHTKNLYERAGVTARLITVSRPLVDRRTPP